ncbi:unnamed protein product [Allacma fusca]|uniref:Ionotropic glutamate receptor L-glutamate and glycine-binding domain-containing protein n=1 Tax=Allacma fusca TaxID=39272 RepID=A0A8J2KLU6_9HEXA|nr:unnamed protein product [Allacma fusca]
MDSFTFQLLEALQFTMNFTIKVIVSHSWGDFIPESNKWGGMIAELLAGEVDIAISSTSDIPLRRTVIDFNIPTNTLKLSGFFKKPRAVVDAKALIEPFKGSFWFAVISVIVSLSLVLIFFKWVLVRAVSHTKEYSSDLSFDEVSVKTDLQRLDIIGSRDNSTGTGSCDDPQSLWCPSDCFQWALAAFCIQGFYNIPKYDCYRIVIGMGFLSGVLIYGAYAGTLISFLSVVVDSVTSVEQLMEDSFVLSIVGNNISQRFFRDSPSPSNRKVYQRRRMHPVYYGLDETKRELLSGSFVFFMDQLSGYNTLNNKFSVKDSCSIQELRIPNAAQKQGSMVPKNSPYKRRIDFQILRMIEHGLIDQLNRRFIPKRTMCSNSVTFDGVQLTSVTVAFGILGIGALLSFAIVVIENGRSKLTQDEYNL